jgi:small GTP-binding protein
MLFHKVCLIGSFGVGKTSLVRRFVSSIYDDRYLTTVGVKIDKKVMQVGGKDLTLVLWDLAGEDDYASLSMNHLRGMSGYLLVADGCRRNTLDVAKRLQDEVAARHPDLPFLLLVNKSDLRPDWEIADSDLDAVRQSGWTVMETSARSGDCVEQAFAHLAAGLLG